MLFVCIYVCVGVSIWERGSEGREINDENKNDFLAISSDYFSL